MSERAKEYEHILEIMLDSKGNANPNIIYKLLSEDWRKMASKIDKTEAEKKALDVQYKTAIVDLACDYLKYVALKMNKSSVDGHISKEVFLNYIIEKKKKVLADKNMMDVSQLSSGFINKIVSDANLMVKRILRGKNKEFIDKKDYAAYLYTLDWASEGENKNRLNGLITARNFALSSVLMVENVEENLIDLKLKYAYKNLFGEE